MHPYGLQMSTDKPTLTAEAVWSDRVYEFQKTDPVEAGADGIDNLPLNQLAARTNYLRVMGIAAWTAVFNYPIGGFCQVSGVVYRAIVANTGKPPEANPRIWSVCPMTTAEISAALNFVAALNGKQDADNTLTALANLTTSADKMIYATGADQFALTPLTAFIRTLLDDADAGAARATLGAAPLASPALTGVPTAPTAAAGTNTTQIATTAFVNAEIVADRPFEATTANIKMDGTQAVGTLNTVARGDHVHPTDTSRAPLASPALTGTPTAPTPATGTRTTQLATTAFVGAECQIAAPTGSVYTFAGATVPTGWLKCNGALLSRTTYAALFAVIGTTYGAGDGSTTFALPDLRGEFVRGFDDARGIDAGRTLGSSQASQNLSHTHTEQGSGGHSHTAWSDSQGAHSHVFESPPRMSDTDRGVGNASLWNIDGTTTQTTSIAGAHTHGVGIGPVGNHTHTIDASGGSESRPRNIAMHYIIKF